MKIRPILFSVITIAVISALAFNDSDNTSSASKRVADLLGGIRSGNIALTSTHGIGASTGASVHGHLVNNTDRDIRVAVNLDRPLFMRNSNRRSQNMLATRVFNRDGTYLREGNQSFITLEANKRIPVTFIAYCVDFEKDNPAGEDLFTVSDVPTELVGISGKIQRYERNNPDADSGVALQLALWLAQGENIREIREKFEFTSRDEQTARRLIGQ